MSVHTILGVLRALLLIVTIILGSVGVAGPVIIDKDNDDNFLSYWLFKDGTGTPAVETYKIACDTLKSRMMSGSATEIIGIVFSFSAFVFAALDIIFGMSGIRKFFLALSNFVAFAFLLVGWAIAVAIYHRDYCGFAPKNGNYKLGYGAILMIVAWIALTLSVLVGVVFGITAPAEDSDDASNEKELESANSSKTNSADNSPKENEPAATSDSEEKKKSAKSSKTNSSKNTPKAN